MSTLIQPLPAPKQIRFVNNQGQPPSKRRRINAACLTCRKRKTRCAGERPTCSTCAKNGHHCLGYTEIVEKKKEHGAHGLSGSSAGTGSTGAGSSGTTSRERSAATDVKSEDDDYGPDEPIGDAANTVASFAASADNDVTRPEASDDEDEDDDDDDSNNSSKRRRKAARNAPSQGHPRSQASQNGEWGHNPHKSQQPQQPQQSQQSQQPRETQQNATSQRLQNYRRSVSFHEGSQGSTTRRSPSHFQQQHQHQHHSESHRVPYFRYFGPTAIVPGYKQMVVDVSVRDRRRSRGSSFSTSSPATAFMDGANYHRGHNGRQANFDPVFESLEDLPVYDPNDSAPVHPLILNLIKTFFVHLGCNYPFLRENRVLRMVREKRVEAILVDSMCALAARFSDLPIFTNGSEGDGDGDGNANGNTNGSGDVNGDGNSRISRSEYGHVFAQRAKAATVDTFPCPSVAAVQACLLMAYEGFGADQDSALWMYLGLAIRMAVDLGLQKKVGVTPQGEKDPWFMRTWNEKSNGERGCEDDDDAIADNSLADGKRLGDGNIGDAMDSRGDDAFSAEDLHAAEQERADTFWAVFFLDRVISSGTGRPVTFRDDDFELALPEPMLDPLTEWPAPFPILAQIIHLYGRVSDVLNNIRTADDLTQEKMQRLAYMENDLTQLYQKQDPRLNFNATNFQAYVRAGQGTTFILLHFWFHALIIILHQPTLLAPFGGLRRMHQLLPNSHELSMSSAKTIADILAFAELIDPKSFIGNPFTSQPMYIAACAFLMESIANASLPTSRDATPPPSENRGQGRSGISNSGSGAGLSERDMRTAASSKHSLLASNANQNYQRCYKSLQQLHLYWGGVRYILTALDQKSKGIWDCETFTSEELESTRQPMRQGSLSQIPRFDNPTSPNVPPIAWSLTGTSNSSNPSLTLLYQSHPNGAAGTSSNQPNQESTPPQHKQPRQRQQQPQQQAQRHRQSPPPASAATPPGNMIYDPIRQSLPEVPPMYPSAYPQANVSAIRYSAHPTAQTHQQPPQYQQQHSSQHPTSSFSGSSSTVYQYGQIQQSDMDTTSPGSGPDGQQGLYAGNNIPYHGQQHQHRHQQHPLQQNHDQQLHHQGHMPQHRSDIGQSQSQQQSQQPLPAPVQSYNTPSSRHSSSYEGAVLPGTSPSSNELAEFGQANVGAASTNSHPSAMGHLDGNGLYQADFGQGGLVGGPYSYLETSPITDVITFDSQEIDISSLALPTEIVPQQWLEYLPTNVLNLFDDNMNGANQ